MPNETANHQGYEPKDVGTGLVFWSLFGMTVITVICIFACLWALNAMLAQPDAVTTQVTPLAAERALPPEPRLQPLPPEEWKEYEQIQETRLNSYGWVDPEAGTVFMPIERAIEVVAERGLERPAAAVEAPVTPPATLEETDTESPASEPAPSETAESHQ